MKVIGRPFADGRDVSTSIELVLHQGTDNQRRQLLTSAQSLQSANADYAAFLRRKFSPVSSKHP